MMTSSDSDKKPIPTAADRARLGYRLYSWTNWIRRIWGWITSAGAGNATAGLGAAAVVATSGALVVSDVRESQLAQQRLAVLTLVEPQAPAAKQALGQEATVYVVRGRDSAGRQAEFDVVVLSRDFHWVKGRSDQMERDGKVLTPDDLRRILEERELGQRLARATDLIAVGLASAEGLRATEEARASERGRYIATALAAATRGSKTIWSLDLGQYISGGEAAAAADTDWQRPILIIGLRSASAGIDLAEALASGMNGAANLPKTTSYSRFALTKAN